MAARTWVSTTTKNWSDVTGWDGGVAVPVTTDDITFGPNDGNCTVDALGTWTGGTITVLSTYAGIISQNTGINLNTAAFSQAGGTFTCHSGATFTSTTFSVTGGTFNQGGAFVSTTFTVGAGTFVGSSATITSTSVTLNNAGGNVTATSGIWTMTLAWNASAALTWNANGGTVNLSGSSSQTLTTANSPFNLLTINKTNANCTVSTGTVPLGSNPTTNNGTGTITVNSTLTFSGNWVHTGSLTTGASSTVTGSSTPTLTLNQSLTINAGSTAWPTTMPLTANGSLGTSVIDTGNFSTGTWTISKTGSGSFTVGTSTTVALGANPTITTGTASTIVSVLGTLTATGAVVSTGSGTFSVGGAGTALTGASSISFAGGLTVTSGGTFPTIPMTFACTVNSSNTITATATTLGTCTISGTRTINVATSTTVPLGANPVSTFGTGELSISGTVTFSGNWVISSGSMHVQLGATVTGSSSPTLTIGANCQIESTATWPTTMPITLGPGATAGFEFRSNTISITGVFTINSAHNITFYNTPNIDLGAGPTVTCPIFTVGPGGSSSNSRLVWTGTLTVAGELEMGSFARVTATSTPRCIVQGPGECIINGTAAWQAGLIVELTGSAITNVQMVSGGPLGVTINCIGAAVVLLGNIDLGASPVTDVGSGSITLSSIPALSFTGTWTHTGNLATFQTPGNGGTITGGTGLTLTNGSFTSDATTTLPANFAVTMNITSGTARTFAGAGATYGAFRRMGAGSGALTISGANTFTEFRDNDGSVAHSLTFTAGVTQTAGTFLLSGASGFVLTLDSTTPASAATLHTTGSSQMIGSFLSVKDSTVDVGPAWFALNSTNVSGNTNWNFSLGGSVKGANFG